MLSVIDAPPSGENIAIRMPDPEIRTVSVDIFCESHRFQFFW
jgi:hypothetical protein